jgi:putative ABC transport system permease protein
MTEGVWRWLAAAELRTYPVRLLLAGLAIAIGVSLGFAVHIINRSAADAFGSAVRNVSGDADLQLRAAGPAGFGERLYPRLFGVEGIADASPVVQMRASLGDMAEPIMLMGTDVMRALRVTPTLVGRSDAARAPDALFDMDAVYLSGTALARSGARIGDRIRIRAGPNDHVFTIAGDLPGAAQGQAIGAIDIAAAQWRFGRLGSLDRIDLRLAEGADAGAVRSVIAAMLPAGVDLTDPEQEVGRRDSLSRAYRVNLDMLALVALITGGFLVYSTQSLSVMRRLRQFALLRTIGMQKNSVERQLLAEGLVLGIAGSLAGLALGYGIAALALRLVGGDLGGGYFAGTAPQILFSPFAAALFLGLGVAAAIAGSVIPARQAGRIAPAEALKNAGDPVDPRRRPPWRVAALLAAAGALAAFLPPVAGLPLFGYLAVALIVAGAIAAMPWLARRMLAPLARFDTRLPPFELALRHLLGAPSQASIALAGIVASTGLMIAMAIMVTSFRTSVETWLDTVLSGDLYLSVPGNSGAFDAETQARIASAPGIAAISFSMGVSLTVDPERPPMQLIVRPVGGPGYSLPLIERAPRTGPGLPFWLSEPAARMLDKQAGDAITLPIGKGGAAVRGHVAGIWRDYARQQGGIQVDSALFSALTGDRARGEAEVILAPGADERQVAEAIRKRLPQALAGQVRITEPSALKRQALAAFDRSFAVTYVLEAIAILIGLAGVAATVSAQTIARIREFGMLRHIGMRPRQVVAMLGWEGALLGLIGIAAGAALGLALSQILIRVINPQSFNWTMETALPWPLLALAAVAMVVAAAGTAVLAGSRAVSREAVRAVSEDW